MPTFMPLRGCAQLERHTPTYRECLLDRGNAAGYVRNWRSIAWMPGIFLSYRRSDAATSAGRLFTSLSQYVGSEHIFRDIASIEAGENFEHAIQDAVEKAAVVLIVIGPQWLDLRAIDGTRRIDDPRDYVRREIELALSGDALVIPVLVEGATMPSAESLPMTIRDLTKRNALELSDRRWDSDVQYLFRQLVRGGVAAMETGTGNAGKRTYRLSTTAIAEYIPGFVSLLRRPRRFLAQRASGGAYEIVRAFVFFILTVLIGSAMLLSVYTPKESVIGFGLVALTIPLFVTIALSVPIWVAARLVGITGHYRKLLIILLHQAAILQLAVLIGIWMIVVALDLRSYDIVREALHDALQPSRSFDEALEAVISKLQPMASEVRFAIFAVGLLLLTTLAWTLWSCDAYRRAFNVSRTRAIVALLLLVVFVWALFRLVELAACCQYVEVHGIDRSSFLRAKGTLRLIC